MGISISVTKNNHVMRIQEYTCRNNLCNMNNDTGHRNTETVNACVPVNLCNSDVWTWYNCVQSVHVAMIQIYQNNGIQWNSVSVYQ